MIIIMKQSVINDQAAQKLSALYGEIQYYPDVSLATTQDVELVIVDLEIGSQFLDEYFYNPDKFFLQLSSHGFSSTIKHLTFLMSDVNPRYSLELFCQNFAEILPVRFNKMDIAIYAPVDIGYAHTMLVMPAAMHIEWVVYGIVDKIAKSDIDNHLSALHKIPDWEDFDPVHMLKEHAVQTMFRPLCVGV